MKPKCPKCGKASLVAGGYPMKPRRFFVYCHKCGWTKRVKNAAIIRLAVEPKKPETCKWTLKLYREGSRDYGTGCGVLRGVLEGNYCSGCGKPVEVIND